MWPLEYTCGWTGIFVPEYEIKQRMNEKRGIQMPKFKQLIKTPIVFAYHGG